MWGNKVLDAVCRMYYVNSPHFKCAAFFILEKCTRVVMLGNDLYYDSLLLKSKAYEFIVAWRNTPKSKMLTWIDNQSYRTVKMAQLKWDNGVSRFVLNVSIIIAIPPTTPSPT